MTFNILLIEKQISTEVRHALEKDRALEKEKVEDAKIEAFLDHCFGYGLKDYQRSLIKDFLKIRDQYSIHKFLLTGVAPSKRQMIGDAFDRYLEEVKGK